MNDTTVATGNVWAGQAVLEGQFVVLRVNQLTGEFELANHIPQGDTGTWKYGYCTTNVPLAGTPALPLLDDPNRFLCGIPFLRRPAVDHEGWIMGSGAIIREEGNTTEVATTSTSDAHSRSVQGVINVIGIPSPDALHFDANLFDPLGQLSDWLNRIKLTFHVQGSEAAVEYQNSTDQPTVDDWAPAQLSQELLQRLAYLASLPANWDGEGAAPVTQSTIDKLKSLLLKAYSVRRGALPEPFIGPTHDGMLVAEWKTDAGKELILDVPPDELSPGFLLLELQASGEEQETDAKIGGAWPIERVIRQLLAN